MTGEPVVKRPSPWENPDPAAYHFEPMEADPARWRVDVRRPCRYTVIGRRQCRQPSVLAVRRGERRPQWWAYCGEHTFGRWVEDGRVWEWRLVPNGDES